MGCKSASNTEGAAGFSLYDVNRGSPFGPPAASSGPQTQQCEYVGERVALATAEARCATLGLTLCDWRDGAAEDNSCGYNDIHAWLGGKCAVQVQVHNDGNVGLVHADSDYPSAALDSVRLA